jgi:hypothetical protein
MMKFCGIEANRLRRLRCVEDLNRLMIFAAAADSVGRRDFFITTNAAR